MKNAQYWLGYWERAKELSVDSHDVLTLITNIQNDAIGIGDSTPVAKKSGTLPERNVAKAAPARLDPVLEHWDSGFYTLNYKSQDANFDDELPFARNCLPQSVKDRVIAKLFAMGFRATQPMLWVAEGRHKWVLVPQNEWKNDTVTGDIYSGNAD